MGIFSRLADIINSNINALLDEAEDPRKLIRLIIQEMEETLVEVRSDSVKMIADKKEAYRRLDRLHAESAQWEEKAKLALRKGREDLAKAAITEKNEIHEEAVLVEKELKHIEGHLTQLEEEITQLQLKLNEAKARQKSMLLRESTARSRYKVKQSMSDDNIGKAFDKFAAFERRLDEFEGQVESMDIGRQDLASEIDKLAEDEKVEAELDRLRKEMQGGEKKGDAE